MTVASARHGPEQPADSPSICPLLRKAAGSCSISDHDGAGRALRPAGRSAEVEQLARAGPARIAGGCNLARRPKDPDDFLKEHGAVNTAPCWSKRRSGLDWQIRAGRWKGKDSGPLPTSSSSAVRPWWHCWASCPRAGRAQPLLQQVAERLLRRSGPASPETRGRPAPAGEGRSAGMAARRAAGEARRWQPATSGPRLSCCGSICTPPATAAANSA